MTKPQLEVLHLWRTEGEQHALAVFEEYLKKKGVEWTDYPVRENYNGVKDEYAERLAIGLPPDMVQWFVGNETRQLVKKGVFRLVPDPEGKLAARLRPEIYELVSLEGGLSGVPVGIHTLNQLIYSVDLLQKYELGPPESWEDLVEHGEVLAQHNIPLIALSKEGWQIRTLLAAILSSVLTSADFELIQSERADMNHIRERLDRAIRILLSLKPYAHGDAEGMQWEQAIGLVENGKALVTVHGDYALTIVENQTQVSCALPPGGKLVLWGVDSFMFTNTDDPQVLSGQDAFLEAAFNPEIAAEYVKRKGGLTTQLGNRNVQVQGCIKSIADNWDNAIDRIWNGNPHWRQRLNAINAFAIQEWESSERYARDGIDRLLRILQSL